MTTPTGNGTLACSGCKYIEKDIYDDPIYIHKARPLMYACAAILPVAYIVGLIFTLKTHAYLYENNPSEDVIICYCLINMFRKKVVVMMKKILKGTKKIRKPKRKKRRTKRDMEVQSGLFPRALSF
jgi:hypothetical protein